MSTIITLSSTWTLFALWQSTLLLGLALLFEQCYRQSPWRRHLILAFGIFSAVLAPTISTFFALSGGGVLRVSIFFVSLPEIFVTVLLCGVVLSAMMLLYGIISSRRLMFHALPFPDRESQEALLDGAKMMQNVSLPILFTSNEVKSPTVWSWGLHPAILLPERFFETISKTERDAIFLHELAHIVRRDHFVALLTRICGVILFWQPLYWLAFCRSDVAADESCDLLVLEQGNIAPENYTETLLRLVAGESYRPIFQFLSRKEQMMKRINTILDFSGHSKSAARQPLWTFSVFITIIVVTVTLALCQEKKQETPITKHYQETPVNEYSNSIYNGGSHWDKLNDLQITFARWDEDQFDFCYDIKTYESKKDSEAKWIKKLEESEPVHLSGSGLDSFYEAINGLAFLKSKAAIPALLRIATEQIHKDNSYRDNSIKALGWIGEPKIVPELIPLLYFPNINCRLNAQIALVRLTGQNFGYDRKAWGKWWNENKKQFGENLPEFELKFVDWINVPIIDYLKNTKYEKDFTSPEVRSYGDPEVQILQDKNFCAQKKAEFELKNKIKEKTREKQKKSNDQFFGNQSDASNPDTPKKNNSL